MNASYLSSLPDRPAPLPPYNVQGTRAAAFLPAAVALAAGLMLLYLATPTRHYTFDAVAYAYQIDRFEDDGRPSWLFHVHHLLFNVAGWLAHELLRGVGMDLSSLEALQALNAVFGGVGVALFGLALARATGRPILAVGLALLLGVSHGYWTCATDGRVNLPGLVLVIGAFGAALRWLESGSPAWARGSGVLTGLAILFHQSHILFAPALAVAALLSPVPWRRKLGGGLAAAGALAAVAGIGYGVIGVAFEGVQDLNGFAAWVWGYGADGRWWSLDWRANLPLSAAALRRAAWGQAPPGESGVLEESIPALHALSVPPIAALALLLGGLLLTRPLRRHAPGLLLCVTWFAAYAAFFTIWDPGYFVFWIPQLAAALFAAGFLIAGLLPDGEPVPARRPTSLLRPVRPGKRLARPRPAFARWWTRSWPRSIRVFRLPHSHLQRGAARLQARRRCEILAQCRQGRRVTWRPVALLPSKSKSRSKSTSRSDLTLTPTLTLTRSFPPRRPVAPSPRRPLAPPRPLAAARLAFSALVTALLFAAVPVLFFRSYRQEIGPRMEASTNGNLRLAETVRQATRPGDLVLVTGAGWLALGEVYIPYFSRRPMLALQAVLKQEQGDKEAAFERLRQEMERRWSRGQRVYVLHEMLTSRAAYATLAERYGVRQSDSLQFFEPYAPRRSLQAGPHSIWLLSRPGPSSGDDTHAKHAKRTERLTTETRRHGGSRREVAGSPRPVLLPAP